MSIERLKDLPGFGIDAVAEAAGTDAAVLRMENLDTDLRPPESALAATRAALDDDDANSYLPFTGRHRLRRAVAAHVSKLADIDYQAGDQVVITAGGTEGLLNVLLATVDPGAEVIVTDPTYAGMINRVRLAGAVPRFVPFHRSGRAWRLDLDALRAAVGPRTRAVFLMNPSMPSGAVLDDHEWAAIAHLCCEHDLWLIYNAAMERILYDGRPYRHPAALPGMAGRTLTVGSVSKEFRMIGWRVGWVVGPVSALADVARVGIYNVVTPVGICQQAAAAALEDPEPGLKQAVLEWQRRRDFLVNELDGLPLLPAAGGWSMLLDAGQLGVDAASLSRCLLEHGRIAATPMCDWGPAVAAHCVRLVFSNEPVARLEGFGERVRAALHAARKA